MSALNHEAPLAVLSAESWVYRVERSRERELFGSNEVFIEDHELNTCDHCGGGSAHAHTTAKPNRLKARLSPSVTPTTQRDAEPL